PQDGERGPDVRHVHGYRLSIELDDDDAYSRYIFELIGAPEALSRLSRFKDWLGLRDELIYIHISQGDGERVGGWESTTNDPVHRIDIFGESHKEWDDERVFHSLAHEMLHVFVQAHGLGWLNTMLIAEPNERDARLP